MTYMQASGRWLLAKNYFVTARVGGAFSTTTCRRLGTFRPFRSHCGRLGGCGGVAQWNTRNNNVSTFVFVAEHQDLQQQQRRRRLTTHHDNPYNQDIARAIAEGRLRHVAGVAGTEVHDEMGQEQEEEQEQGEHEQGEQEEDHESKWALVERVEEMLFHMLDLYENGGVHAARPTAETFQLVARAYRTALAGGGTTTRHPHDAVQAYLTAQQQHHEGILQSLLPSPTPESDTLVQKTEGLLKLAECLHDKDPAQWHDLRPTTAMFNILLRSYALGGITLVKEKENHPQDPSRYVLSDEYAAAVAAVSDLPQRALAVYQYMADHSEAHLKPNASSMALCLQVLANRLLMAGSTNKDKLKLLRRADRLLQQLQHALEGSPEEALEEEEEQGGEEEKEQAEKDAFGPELLVFRSTRRLLMAWSRLGTKQGVLRALDLLMQMVHLSNAREAKISQAARSKTDHDEEENVSLPPPLRPLQIPTEVFTTLISACSNWGGTGSGQGANDVLEGMMALYQEGRLTTPPPPKAFAMCIKAWGFERPRNRPERAEAVLEQMHALHESGSPLWEHLCPNVVCFNTVLSAYARNGGQEGAALQAQALLDHMKDLCASGGNPTACPDGFTYLNVITAWTRTRGGTRQAEALLREMQEVYARDGELLYPMIRSYGAVAEAWAMSDTGREGAHRALDLMHQVEAMLDEPSTDDDERPGIKFDIDLYATAVKTFGRTELPGAGRMAMRLFKRVDALYQEGEETMRPTVYFATEVVRALTDGWEAGNVQRAVHVMERMEELYAETQGHSTKPSVELMNRVMKCVSRTRGDVAVRIEAFEVARTCFQKLSTSSSSDLRRNTFSYAFFLKACHHLLAPSAMRDDIVRQALEECREQQCLHERVLFWADQCLPSETISRRY